MLTKNHIESQYRIFKDALSLEYTELYQNVENEKLRAILSTIHADMVGTFGTMNERLPTGEHPDHFWADPSRVLIKAITSAESLQRALKNTQYAFKIDEYYASVITQCKNFLNRSGGSTIPPHMEKIELYYTLPVFIPLNSLTVNNPIASNRYNLNLIGEGSYAHVYKYKDDFYQRYFVLKRAKKDLNDKEIERFAREFHTMSQLASPYIVDVYNYNTSNNEYVMEYMDSSLSNYIEKHNSKLNGNARQNIGRQALKAFAYLHSKNILHRDISLTNVLIKEYEHTLVVKLSDFGLVKLPESNLTSDNTDFKGSLNDPSLKHEGFDNYGIPHEIYALTLLLCFILTGKTNTQKIKNVHIRNFALIGTNPDKNKRFASIDEVMQAFNNLFS